MEKHLIDIWLPFAKPANVMENDAGEPVMDSSSLGDHNLYSIW